MIPSLTELRKPLTCLNWIYRSFQLIGAYALWVELFRLLTLTLITYFTISPHARFQDISDAFGSNEVSLMGLAAVLYLAFLCSLNPISSITPKEILNQEQIEKNFLPGFIRGAILAAALISIFVLLGLYRYLGYFIQFEDAPLELANVFLRMVALASLAYSEEFIFRNQLTRYLTPHLPVLVVANVVALLYCGVKFLQFDLGLTHLVTLYLISLSLSLRVSSSGRSPSRLASFARGAGIWAALLIIFHPVLSLPLFGNDFSGILLIKPSPDGKLAEVDPSSPVLIRLITGGTDGPISSIVFQLLLILDIGRSILRLKKTT